MKKHATEQSVKSEVDITYSGVTTYVIAWMLQTCRMAPSLIYTVSFSLCKIIQISAYQN